MEFQDNYPQYELMAHHSEEEGKLIRRKLWNVFWIMLGVTIVELIIGSFALKMGLLDEERHSSFLLKVIFIGLTIAKAFFIIFSFMHLGGEKKSLRYSIIGPYMIFVLYLVFIAITEANYSRGHKQKMDDLIIIQKENLNKAALSGKHEEEPAEGENSKEKK